MDINASLKKADFKKPTNINIDKGASIITYNKYKGYTLPLIVIAVSILMLIFIVIPEINQFFVTQKQLDEETQKLNMLKNNYNFLTNLDEKEEGKNLKSLTKVMPIEKDFFGIMTSVSVAASLSSSAIDNYKFYLGNLSKLTGENTQFPTVLMEITLIGSGVSINGFINELYKTVPLAEVSIIKYKEGKAILNVAFYYKPFPPQNVSDDTPVSQLSEKEQKLINNVSTWNNLSIENQNFLQGVNIISSSSGNLNFEATPSSKIEFSPFN